MRNPKPSIDRRAALAGAGAVGALATAAAVLPGSPALNPAKPADAAPQAEGSAGYRLTEHIKRYYASTRI